MSLVTAAGLAAVLTVLRAPSYRDDAYRRKRTWTFIGFGLSAILPIAAAVYLYGAAECRRGFGLGWLLLEGVLYVRRVPLALLTMGQISGALLYAERVPERFLQGQTDLFGSSHQICAWATVLPPADLEVHVLILLAVWSHCARGATRSASTDRSDAAVAEAWQYRHVVLRGSCGIAL